MSGGGGSGSWVELDHHWHDTLVRNCPVCGKVITRRSWAFTADGAQIQVCAPDCEQLYVTYWRPRYGALPTSERSR